MLLALSSCKKDTLRITEQTEEWLQTKSDTKLNFTSHTGEKEELTISVKKDTRTLTGPTGDKKYEYYLLTYQGKQNDLGFVVLAENNILAIRNIGEQDFTDNFVALLTGKTAADDYLDKYQVEAELINNLTLDEVTYDRVLRVKFYLPPGRTDKINEVYYAKKHGLVFFQTTDGQFWSLDN
ncbi:hypothetical protein GCM10027293_09330 [Pontibacter aydingkolensis]